MNKRCVNTTLFEDLRPAKISISPCSRMVKMGGGGNRVYGGGFEFGESCFENKPSGGMFLMLDPSRSVEVNVTGFATIHPRKTDNNVVIGSSPAPYTTYQIHVSCRTGTRENKWFVFRRYSTFMTFVYRLMKCSKGSELKLPGLPMQTTGHRSVDSSFIRDRALGLHEWLQVSVGLWKSSKTQRKNTMVSELFAAFLTEEPDFWPIGLDEKTMTKFSPPTTGSFSPKGELQNCDPNASPRSSLVAVTNKKLQQKRAPRRRDELRNYNLLKVIGQGSFGKVILGQHDATKSWVAIKALDKCEMVRRNQILRVEVERKCMAMSNCPFIVQLHSTFATATHVYFVQEFCAGGEVFFHLQAPGKLSAKRSRFYAGEVVLALDHLHSLGIAFRDLKPENMMIDSEGHIKLVDFGLAKMGVEACRGAMSFVGTQEYFSPEVLAKRGHGYAVDYWSLGMVLYELLTGLPPWYTDNRERLFSAIQTSEVTFPHGEVSVNARKFIRELLDKDPRSRLGTSGVEKVKSHPYFKMLDFNLLEQKKIKPPYVPTVESGFDTRYFDDQFTNLPVHDKNKPVINKTEEIAALRKAESMGCFKNF